MQAKLSPAIFATCLTAAVLSAQPTPGSVATHLLPFTGGSFVIDPSGSVYLIGGKGPVTPGAAQTQVAGGGNKCSLYTPGGPVPCSDAYIGKADASGNIVFGTLLGGPTNDTATSGVVDSAGNVYVTGSTGGSFPTTPGAAIPSSTTGGAFAAKLSSDGSKFLYSTYLPGNVSDQGVIAVDPQGNAYIAGLLVAGQGAVVKLSADGTTIVYTKLLAGLGTITAINVDAAGNVFLAGYTRSSDFPVTTGVVQPQLAGIQNAFVTKLDPSGNIAFSTFLGGSGYNAATVLQLDADGNILIAGWATSPDFPTTPDSFAPSPVVPAWSQSAGFFTKLSADATSLVYSTDLQARVYALAQDLSGGVYISTNANYGPGIAVTPNAPEACLDDGSLLHLDANGTVIEASYSQSSGAIAAAADGSVLLVGNGQLEQIRFGDPGWIAPACMTNNLLSSATLAGTLAVPGQFVTLSGFGIGPEIGAIGRGETLGGVQVLFDGVPAPVIYAQSRQVNAQVPFELAGQSTNITLTYERQKFGPFNVKTFFAYPGLFRVRPNISTQAYAVNQDGKLNSVTNPAARGSVIALWGTGFGQTVPGCSTGALNPPGPANLTAGFVVQFDNGGPVLYAGGAPTFPCGVSQINMQIPNDKPPGALSLSPQVSMDNGHSFVQSDYYSVIYIK